MIIVRLLSPGPWLVGTTKVYPGVGADIVMESITERRDSAVKAIDGLADESPASAGYPVGTVVISGDGAGDNRRKPGCKRPRGVSALRTREDSGLRIGESCANLPVNRRLTPL